MHYGAGFILRHCDSAVWLVSYRFGTWGGTAYLDAGGRVSISIPDSLSFTNFKGHYIKTLRVKAVRNGCFFYYLLIVVVKIIHLLDICSILLYNACK